MYVAFFDSGVYKLNGFNMMALLSFIFCWYWFFSNEYFKFEEICSNCYYYFINNDNNTTNYYYRYYYSIVCIIIIIIIIIIICF